MIEVAASLGLVTFLLTSIVVGGRLVGLWRQTRKLPELLVGLGFLLGGVFGFVPEHLILRGVIGAPWDGPLLVLANLAIRTTAMLCAVFTWHVFRRADRRALAALIVLGALLAVSFVGFPGPWARAQTEAQWNWSVVTAVVRFAAFLWAAVESLRQASLARRRAALGLVSAEVARRYLLWGVAMAGPAAMSAVPLLNRWLLLPNPGPDIAWMLFQSALGLVAAGGMAAAFLSRGTRARAKTSA